MTKPFLTTTECADIISMTSAYLRGEIRDGRLTAEIIHRPVSEGRKRSRPIIRVYPEHFAAYLKRYWPRVSWNQPAA